MYLYFTDRGIEELEERRGGEQVSVAWLAEHGTQTQMGFSMGRFPTDW